MFKLVLGGRHGQFAGFDLFFQFKDIRGVLFPFLRLFVERKHKCTSFLNSSGDRNASSACKIRFLLEVYPKFPEHMHMDKVLTIDKCNRN